MVERDDLYAVLGLTPSATPEQVRRAYRAMMRRHHPDTRGADDPDDRDEALQRAVAAYAVLGDPEARAAYDRVRGARHGHSVTVRHTQARQPSGEDEPAIRVGPVRWHRAFR